jgi:hypothetical protein
VDREEFRSRTLLVTKSTLVGTLRMMAEELVMSDEAPRTTDEFIEYLFSMADTIDNDPGWNDK